MVKKIINRYFNSPLNHFFETKKLNKKNIYCDIESMIQYPNFENCNMINHITDHKIFGDKYTHYYLLKKHNSMSKYLLETHLFNINNIQKIKQIIKKYPVWIIKPRNDYGRKGVNIIRNYNDIYKWIDNEKSQEWILQKYIKNPLLIKKKKFHIRIYVIITINSTSIKFYIYKKGFIYTSTKPYKLYSNDLKSHLSGEDSPNNVILFDNKHILYYKVWDQIKHLVLKSIIPLQQYIKCPNISNKCYKFLGLDILIDSNYNLYLAEINSRLISLKYPPKNFKNDMYLDILNTVYFNKPKQMDFIYKKSLIDHFNNKIQRLKLSYILSIIIILIISVNFIKKMVF